MSCCDETYIILKDIYPSHDSHNSIIFSLLNKISTETEGLNLVPTLAVKKINTQLSLQKKHPV